MKLGNTTGRTRKPKEAKIPAGCFDINAMYDWIIGGKIPDEREHRPSEAPVYHMIKANTKRKYF
jgi:hypothetical protein